jgi:thioredoxin 1
MEITEDLLREKITNGDKIIVDFWAPWCGPCKLMKPKFDNVAEEVNSSENNITMYTMNVEENRDLASSLGIRSIPTVKAFSNGVEVYSNTGLLLEPQIKNVVTLLIHE